MPTATKGKVAGIRSVVFMQQNLREAALKQNETLNNYPALGRRVKETLCRNLFWWDVAPHDITGILSQCVKHQEPQHMTCNLASSYLPFSSNKCSFVSVCSFLFSVAVPNNYSLRCISCSLTVSFLQSASTSQYHHLCHEVSFWKLLESQSWGLVV